MEINNITGNSYIEKIDKLNSSAEEVIRHTPIKSIEFSNEAFELSKQIQYKKGIAKSLFIMGKASYIVGNFEEAISFLMDALQITQDESFRKYEADVLNVLGNVNLDLTNFNIALEYYMKWRYHYRLFLLYYLNIQKLYHPVMIGFRKHFSMLLSYGFFPTIKLCHILPSLRLSTDYLKH